MRMTVVKQQSKIFDTKLLLLTGAGASKPLGMPLMKEFYSLVWDKCNKTQRNLLDELSDIHREETGEHTPDLEALLALVEKYRQFYDILFGDKRFGYIKDEDWERKEELKKLTWQDVPGGTSYPRTAGYDYIKHSYYRAEDLEGLETLLRNLLFEEYGKKLDDNQLDELYSPLFKVINKHFTQDFIPIFTTNYDSSIETYGTRRNVYVETGFETKTTGSFWNSARFSLYQTAKDKLNLVLFKLHGSVTWHRTNKTIQFTGLPIRDPSGYKSVVIYPTQTKDFLGEPANTMYNHLKGCLEVAKVAIVIGYSFRDQGIHRILVDALEHNPDLFFILICGSNEEHWKKFAQTNLKSYHIISRYFDFPAKGGEYLVELDAALAKLKS